MAGYYAVLKYSPPLLLETSNSMKITHIDLHVLLIPDYDVTACSSAQDDLVVEVHTDEGIVGIGETDTNPWIAGSCIRAGTHCMGLGLQELLIGADPMQPELFWKKLYEGSKMTGRRGALICAHSARSTWRSGISGQGLGPTGSRACWRGGKEARYPVRVATAHRADARRIRQSPYRENGPSESTRLSGRETGGMRERTLQSSRAARK